MSSVILYHNLYLGDNFICNGLVREYCKTHDRVAIFCYPAHYGTVSFMYRDLPNLTIIKGDDADAILYAFLNTFRRAYDEVKIVGMPYLDPYRDMKNLEHCEDQFYRLAGLDPKKKWESFRVERDRKREEELFRRIDPPRDYAFLHDDFRYRIDRKRSGQLPAVSPAKEITDNVFDYCLLIERAKEVHVIDSSFMYLVDLLPDFPQKLFVHRYARPNILWALPTLRKNWTILT